MFGGMLAVVVAVDSPVLVDENSRAQVRNVRGHSPRTPRCTSILGSILFVSAHSLNGLRRNHLEVNR